MANTWKIYRNSKIIPEKNFKVDSIHLYLRTLPKVTITGGQYIKHDLAITLKVNLTQEMLSFFDTEYNINYVEILNDDEAGGEVPVYYFILNRKWISEKCILLNLCMDTINTFTEERDSFIWSDRTLVNREHKDRIIKLDSQFVPEAVGTMIKGVEYTIPFVSTYRFTSGANAEDNTNTMVLRKRLRATPTTFTDTPICKVDFVKTGSHACRFYKKVSGLSSNQLVESVSELDFGTSNYIYSVIIYGDVLFSDENLFASNFGGYWQEGKAYRNIDLYSEGLTPVLFKEEVEEISNDNMDWYLIYKNQNEPSETLTNPVDCLLCASSEFKVTEYNRELQPSELDEGNYYTFLFEDNPNLVFYLDGVGYALRSDRRYNAYFYKRVDGKIGLSLDEYREDSSVYSHSYWKHIGAFGTTLSIQNGSGYYILHEYPDGKSLSYIKAVGFQPISGGTEYTVKTINTLDRTDAKLIKIIKLPYPPTTINEEDLSGVWGYDEATGFLKLKDLNTKFVNTIDTEAEIFGEMMLDENEIATKTTETLKDSKWESKLLHSDYYQQKFVYDSFSFVFQLERMDPSIFYDDLDFDFVTTSTINSRFLFSFPQYKTGKLGSQDYDNILSIARNNEVTIYNQQYMNYLRAGYNYDVKSKTRQETASILGTGLSLVGAIASFASSGATGGVGIAAGISFLTGAASGIVSTVNTVAQAEQNMEAKQTQLKNQSTSVAGSDDVDLMSYYANNKAKIVLYKVSERMKKSLYDMFFYTGYISGEMKIPNQNSRVWFNFVSCEPQFEQVYNIPDNCLDNLKERYKGGVTIMHYHNSKWNWERNFENWEISLNIHDPQ